MTSRLKKAIVCLYVAMFDSMKVHLPIMLSHATGVMPCSCSSMPSVAHPPLMLSQATGVMSMLMQ